ncbi:MAG: phosphopantothenoylcysteine [Candidatus Brocadia fulgida]|uniref:Phosphopantothenoylcysteine n=1 Tax=Candidatus Brocadia fulgida TaxID=380242 RepID=A0A0M2UY17_9BACT|nr:MAG: phosphopantothenoylcysteine [Candidatus Brocadia fulgida]
MIMSYHIVLGVTGSIAAYKAVELVSCLTKQGNDVVVIMTSAAQRFVHPVTFRSISHNRVVTDLFIDNENYDPNHVSLAEQADLLVVAPATANFIGKVASGIADDALTCTVMAARSPVIIAPAMNDSMYLNPIVQENIKKLTRHGYRIIEPEEGRLCTGRVGKGRLAAVEKIVGVIAEELNKMRKR